jgi:hypothetical protein
MITRRENFVFERERSRVRRIKCCLDLQHPRLRSDTYTTTHEARTVATKLLWPMANENSPPESPSPQFVVRRRRAVHESPNGSHTPDQRSDRQAAWLDVSDLLYRSVAAELEPSEVVARIPLQRLERALLALEVVQRYIEDSNGLICQLPSLPRVVVELRSLCRLRRASLSSLPIR